MNQLPIFIIFALIFSLASCARHEQDNEMTAELEKVTDETTATEGVPLSNETAGVVSEGEGTQVMMDGEAVANFEPVTAHTPSSVKPTPETIQTALQASGFYNGKVDV